MHGGWARSDGSHLGDVHFNAKTAAYFRENIQFPFFEHYLKGKGAAQAKAVVFETGTNVWRRYDAWPPKSRNGEDALLSRGRQAEFRSAGGSQERRRVCERSQPSGAVCGLHHQHGAATIHGGRPAFRQLSARRAGVRDRAVEGRRDDRRPDHAAPEDGEFGNGLRFRREADRRLSGGYSRPGQLATPASEMLEAPPLHMGGYQQLLRGEPFRAKFRNSWEKPEPLTPGKADRHRLHDARSVPHLPPRPSHHGAGAEFVVSADGPQSADVHRYSLCASRRISRRRPRRFFTRRMRRAASRCWCCRSPEVAAAQRSTCG